MSIRAAAAIRRFGRLGVMLAAAILIWIAGVALRIEPPPVPRDSTPQLPATRRLADERSHTGSTAELRDLFHAPFTAQEAQSRMEDSPSADVQRLHWAQRLRLLGTTVFSSGDGFAVLQSHDGHFQIVPVGSSASGFVLRKVGRGTAALATADSVVVLTLEPR